MNDVYTQVAKDLNITNIHSIPKITKVIVHAGVGKQRDNKAFMAGVEEQLAKITGQKPSRRLAKKAIAGFNVRQRNTVGYQVTLRGKRMEDFITRFVNITLPRVRDFRGLNLKNLDKQGNLNVGIREQLAFPEIHPDKTDIVFGIQVTFVTSTDDRKHAEHVFRGFGFPFIS